MEKKNINKMIFLMFLCIIVYNLAHPATPGLIELRNWKKSISGEFLAVMSTAMFISSPYLGALADNIGMKRIFVFKGADFVDVYSFSSPEEAKRMHGWLSKSMTGNNHSYKLTF